MGVQLAQLLVRRNNAFKSQMLFCFQRSTVPRVTERSRGIHARSLQVNSAGIANELSPERASDFVKDVLGLSDFKESFQADRRTALNSLIVSMHEKVPFQNISYLSVSYPQALVPPSIRENVDFCLSMEGGPCATIGSFTNLLLNALGYRAYSTVAYYPTGGSANHLINIVTDLETTGDQFLVDTAFGYPSFEAVSLDMRDGRESDVITQSLTAFKIIRRGNLYIRVQKMASADQFPQMLEEAWCQAYSFEIVPYDVDEAQQFVASNNYKDPNSVFRSCLHAIRYEDGKAIVVRDMVLSLENEQQLDNTMLSTFSQAEAATQKHFRTIPVEKVTKAFSYWQLMKKNRQFH